MRLPQDGARHLNICAPCCLDAVHDKESILEQSDLPTCSSLTVHLYTFNSCKRSKKRYTQRCRTESQMLCTYNFLLLAEKRMALQSLVELTLRDVRKDLVLSFVRCAVRNSEREEAGEQKGINNHYNFTNSNNSLSFNLNVNLFLFIIGHAVHTWNKAAHSMKTWATCLINVGHNFPFVLNLLHMYEQTNHCRMRAAVMNLMLMTESHSWERWRRRQMISSDTWEILEAVTELFDAFHVRQYMCTNFIVAQSCCVEGFPFFSHARLRQWTEIEWVLSLETPKAGDVVVNLKEIKEILS